MSLVNNEDSIEFDLGHRCGLYVHLPFCQTKCGYCDFYSVVLKNRDTAPLVRGVISELSQRVANYEGRIETCFFGGGTPTLLPVDQLELLLKALAGVIGSGEWAEFTVEANPATVDTDMARLLRDSGVTRVSMGAQSFFPSELDALERIHNPDDIAVSVATLRQAGISQINLDLIFGIPGQTLESWRASLEKAVALGPDHVSAYGLTYEPGTRLTAQRAKGRVAVCDEGLEAEMYELGMDFLAGAGFEQYELSNYARPGARCAHNLTYWRNESYLAIGPSAAGCVGDRRYKNVADVDAYVRMMDEDGCAEDFHETINRATLIDEIIMMQMRLTEGLSRPAFRERTGLDFVELCSAKLRELEESGLVDVSADHVALSRGGRLVADYIITELAAHCGAAEPQLRATEPHASACAAPETNLSHGPS